MKKHINILLLAVTLMLVTGCSSIKSHTSSFGTIIRSDSRESYHKREYDIVDRGSGSHNDYWQEQFPVGQSSLPPTPRRSTTYIDTGRYQYREDKGGHVGYRKGYDPYTGKQVIVTYRDEYRYKTKTDRGVRRIPYDQLPDRGYRKGDLPKGYEHTTIEFP